MRQAATRLLKEPTVVGKQGDSGEFEVPDQSTVQRLDQLATGKLAEIVRRYGAQERRWRGYDPTEIAAAKELLAQKD
jgi:ER membrane protein complex subunit 2